MPDFTDRNITYFGETDFRGKKTPFGIKKDDRGRHVYVIGKTGVGKSTLLENMAIQDIRNGHGLGFLDPHGKSAELLLEYVPEERIKDVLYFAPFDLDHPISFNIMEDVGKDQRHLVANGLVSVFKKIWPDVWSARMEYILNNTILALLEYPGSTLLGINRMLSDKDYRNTVVSNIADPSVKSFWLDEFAKYNERYMQEAGDAIKNKIGQFTSNALIRNIIGQPKSSFDLRELMDKQKILIVNLSKGRVGEQNAFLLGGMIMTKIYLAAMSRANLSEDQMGRTAPFFLFVDEFQSFVNDSFTDILAEARKYKLNLTIAHQYIDQMPETVRSAVFGNVGTTISFRVGPFDAETLEKIFLPKFTQEDLVNLGFAQIYLSLMIDGIGSAPFSARTLPPIVVPADSYKTEIIESSWSQFARTRVAVEEEINKWHEADRQSSESAPARRPPTRSGGAPTFRDRPVTSRPPERVAEPEKKPVPPPPPPSVPVSEPVSPTPTPIAPKLPLSTLKPKVAVSSEHRDELKTVISSQPPVLTPAPSMNRMSLNVLKSKNTNSSQHKEELRHALQDVLAESRPAQPEEKKEAAPAAPSSESVRPANTREKPVPNNSNLPPLRPKEVAEEDLRALLRVNKNDIS